MVFYLCSSPSISWTSSAPYRALWPALGSSLLNSASSWLFDDGTLCPKSPDSDDLPCWISIHSFSEWNGKLAYFKHESAIPTRQSKLGDFTSLSENTVYSVLLSYVCSLQLVICVKPDTRWEIPKQTCCRSKIISIKGQYDVVELVPQAANVLHHCRHKYIGLWSRSKYHHLENSSY